MIRRGKWLRVPVTCVPNANKVAKSEVEDREATAIETDSQWFQNQPIPGRFCGAPCTPSV